MLNHTELIKQHLDINDLLLEYIKQYQHALFFSYLDMHIHFFYSNILPCLFLMEAPILYGRPGLIKEIPLSILFREKTNLQQR